MSRQLMDPVSYTDRHGTTRWTTNGARVATADLPYTLQDSRANTQPPRTISTVRRWSGTPTRAGDNRTGQQGNVYFRTLDDVQFRTF